MKAGRIFCRQDIGPAASNIEQNKHMEECIMAMFWVNQGKTYKQEREGGYVWSPQVSRNGSKVYGFSNMRDVHKGDFVFHNSKAAVQAISVAKTDWYEANQPRELLDAGGKDAWNREGYRIDLEYHDLDTPLNMRPFRAWLVEHPAEKSAFNTKDGGSFQQYMCHLDKKHAQFLLQQIIKQQRTPALIAFLRSLMGGQHATRVLEYEPKELDAINEEVTAADDSVPEWTGERKKQETRQESGGRVVPCRNAHTAARALQHAQYKCEFNPEDRTFIRNNSTHGYTEPHHLIPLSKYRDFEYSLDVMENIVSLCSHCHNLLHYGRFEDKQPILAKLYVERMDALRKVGLNITLEQLESYYR